MLAFIPEMIQPSHTIVEAREIASRAGSHVVDQRQILHEAWIASMMMMLSHKAWAAARKARRVSGILAAAILVSAAACMVAPLVVGHVQPILTAALGGAVACDVLLGCRRAGGISKLQMWQVAFVGMTYAALPSDLAAGQIALYISLGLSLLDAVLTDPFRDPGGRPARICRKVRRIQMIPAPVGAPSPAAALSGTALMRPGIMSSGPGSALSPRSTQIPDFGFSVMRPPASSPPRDAALHLAQVLGA